MVSTDSSQPGTIGLKGGAVTPVLRGLPHVRDRPNLQVRWWDHRAG